VAGLAAVVVLAVCGAWWVAQQTLDRVIDRFVAERRAEGYQMTWRRRGIGGFPLWVEARFEQPQLAAPDGPRKWSWEGTALVLAARPWNPQAVSFAETGRQVLSVAGLAEPVTLTSDGFIGSLTLAQGKPAQAELALTSPELWSEPERPDASARRVYLAIDKWPNPTADEKTEAIAGRVTADELALAPRLQAKLPFADPMDASLTLSLFGAIPPGPPQQALAAWRDEGGIVEIGKLDLKWGPLGANGNGTVTLDESMRPLGAGTAVIHGWEETLDRLVAAGTVQARQASIARVVLSALSKPSADGSEVTVPVTAQNGRLSVGPVPVMGLAPVLR
jgi:hypothetical protein